MPNKIVSPNGKRVFVVAGFEESNDYWFETFFVVASDNGKAQKAAVDKLWREAISRVREDCKSHEDFPISEQEAEYKDFMNHSHGKTWDVFDADFSVERLIQLEDEGFIKIGIVEGD